MKSALPAILFLLVGAAAGAIGMYVAGDDGGGRGSSRQSTVAEGDINVTLQAARDQAEIDRLNAELESLRALLAARTESEATPWPNDSIELIERRLQDAYQDTNVDWLMEVIERLLLMGKEGYPLLRRLIEDIAFKGKFVPTAADFRMDQMYTAGKIFTKHEKEFLGFLNYLLIDNRTLQIMKQGAMMGAAFYVGSKAPGSEELRETLIRQFLEEGGMEGMAGGFPMPPQMRDRMQIMAMAMSGDKSVIPALKDKLKSAKDKRTQGAALKALAYLGDESAIPTIQERLDPSGGDFRDEIEALARIDTPESHEVAANYLNNISNSKSFYRHASRYTRSGGGVAGIKLIQARVAADPNDPDIANAIGTLRTYPSKESLDTLNTIATTSQDEKLQERAANAAEDVQRKLNGEMPDFSKINWGPRGRRR